MQDHLFLAEHYEPDLSVEQLQERCGRLRATAASAAQELAVRLVGSTVLPTEHCALYLFDAESAERVREVYRRSGLEPGRLTPAVSFDGEQPDLVNERKTR